MEKETKSVSTRPDRSVNKRVPVGQRHRLTLTNKDPDFHYRWVNTQDGRPQMFEDAGYEYVDLSKHGVTGSRLDTSINPDNSTPVGQDTRAVAMRIPKEYYDEDQVNKQSIVDARTREGLRPKEEDGLVGTISFGR